MKFVLPKLKRIWNWLGSIYQKKWDNLTGDKKLHKTIYFSYQKGTVKELQNILSQNKIT